MKEGKFIHTKNSTKSEKKQGIFFNTDYQRWEYYGQDSVIRSGEQQPKFVSANYDFCAEYKRKVEGER